MLRLSYSNLRPGLITARNIYGSNGSLLLGRDITLDERLIARLATLGIESVYVKNPYFDYEPQEILHENTKIETIKLTQNAFKASDTKTINFTGLRNAVKMIIEDVIDNRNVLVHLTDIRTLDNYFFGHSINVCLISSFIGLKLCLHEQKLKELALGTILHDIGMKLVPPEVLNKKEALSPEELQLIQGHSQAGFDILRNVDSVPLPAAHVAYQHHEHFDGTGYPRGMSTEDIHQFARIAAVADLYDAITSDRPYRPAMLPHEAYEVVLGSRGTILDPRITDIFLENVAPFPLGTMVLLDTGDIGAVAKVYPKLQTRPVVRLVFDKTGHRISDQDEVIDLTKELTRFVVKVFKPEEVADFKPAGDQ
jgi:HD-GYP domain-containing protein (c-di-GMP phosphodiesterase class II)